jgi:hypothetical protein
MACAIAGNNCRAWLQSRTTSEHRALAVSLRKFGIGRFIKESKSFGFPASQFFKYYLDVLKFYEHATR